MERLMRHYEEDGVGAYDVDLMRPTVTGQNGSVSNYLQLGISLKGPPPLEIDATNDNITTTDQGADLASAASEEFLTSNSELGAVGLTPTLGVNTILELEKFVNEDHKNVVESSQIGTSKTRRNQEQRPERRLCPTCHHGRPPPISAEFSQESVVFRCDRCKSFYNINQDHDDQTITPPNSSDKDLAPSSAESGVY